MLAVTQRGAFIAVFSVPSFYVSLVLLTPKGLNPLQHLG